MLTLPTEAPDARVAVAFDDGREIGRAAHVGGLCVADGEQRRIRYRFDKAVAQSARRDAERARVIGDGQLLHDVGERGARMDERPAERFKELAVDCAPAPEHGHLTCAAGDDVLMTLTTTLRVVGWPQSVRDALHFLEDETIIVERAQRHDVLFVYRLVGRPLHGEAVGQIVKACGRFRRARGCVALGRAARCAALDVAHNSGDIRIGQPFICEHAVVAKLLPPDLIIGTCPTLTPHAMCKRHTQHERDGEACDHHQFQGFHTTSCLRP